MLQMKKQTEMLAAISVNGKRFLAYYQNKILD
ncbi:MAG: hypothetical protein SP1CHLAM42_01300 [Chlamydiales bacterium]|nr:hypothetical protein [Chlamydiales bacterium]